MREQLKAQVTLAGVTVEVRSYESDRAESRVIECLRLIAPVERITLIQHPAKRYERLVLVKMVGEVAPVPLKSMGDGLCGFLKIEITTT